MYLIFINPWSVFIAQGASGTEHNKQTLKTLTSHPGGGGGGGVTIYLY